MPDNNRSLAVALGIIGAVVVLLGGIALAGRSAFWFACGVVPSGATLFSGIDLIISSEAGSLGSVATDCEPSLALIWGLYAGFVLILIAAVVTSIILWRRYKESDRYFLKHLVPREGIAQGAEVRRTVGQKKAKERAKSIRPSMKKSVAADAAIPLGFSQGHRVWASLEESLILLGPPRSGKGFHLLISAIVDAVGSVITTSTRADNYAATHKVRAEVGPVTLFDPQGLTGVNSTLKWSPITGCESPLKATQRATSLIMASGLGSSSNNAEWKTPAISIMACLLHAAALSRSRIDKLLQWGTNPRAAREAVNILNEHPGAAEGWALTLQGIIEGDPKLMQSKWFGVEGAVAGLAVPEIRTVLDPQTKEETFDIDSFIQANGTLYLVGTKTGGGSIGPFLITMLDAITERGREIAAQSAGNRLDPPMSLVLDEIANMAGAWPGLTTLMADGGGIGVSVFAVFQSLAQARNEWGAEAASAIYDAATLKIQLGGSGNDGDLATLVKLMGERSVKKLSRTWQDSSNSTSESSHEVAVMTEAEIRRLPFGTALVLNRAGRPLVLSMQTWKQHKAASRIKASAREFNLERREKGLAPVVVGSGLSIDESEASLAR